MISFFKKKKEEEIFRPLLSGKLEKTFQELSQQFGPHLSGRIYDIDISPYTTEFTTPTAVPRKIQQAARAVLDDYLKSGEEFYFQADEKNFGLFFSKASKAVAELKVQVIQNELARIIEDIKKKKKPSSSSQPPAPQSKPQKTELPEKYTLRDKGTLSSVPDAKEMRDWLSRALANMSTSAGYLDFYADIDHMASLVQVRYSPLWFVKNKIVSGYVLSTQTTLTKQSYDEQRGHEDLAVIGAAARQLTEMQKNEKYALLIVPVHIHTICDQRTGNLYNIFIRTLGNELQRFIVLKITGLNERKLTSADWDTLRGLRYHCRSMIIDTGLSKIPPADVQHIKFHAFGFNLKALSQPEDQLFMHLENFAAFYHKNRKDSFLLGVDTNSLLSASLGAGYSYIAGEAIAPASVRPKNASFLKYENIYDEIMMH